MPALEVVGTITANFDLQFIALIVSIIAVVLCFVALIINICASRRKRKELERSQQDHEKSE